MPIKRPTITDEEAVKIIERAFKHACEKNVDAEVHIYPEDPSNFLDRYPSLSPLMQEVENAAHIGPVYWGDSGLVELTVSPPGKKEKSLQKLKENLARHREEAQKDKERRLKKRRNSLQAQNNS